MTKSNKERMLAGELYLAHDEELGRSHRKGRRLIEAYNQSSFTETEKRKDILQELLGKMDRETTLIQPPFNVDYGENIYLGKNVYMNFDCILLDVAPITIGNDVMFGPRVMLLTPGHPLDATIRTTGIEFGKPITIGNRVWIGGGAIVMPDVTIGDDVIVAGGAVVTKDVPNNVVIGGNPARIIRELNEDDYHFWKKEYDAYQKEMKGKENK